MDNNDNAGTMLGNYLIAYLDILGQGEALRKIKNTPASTDDWKDVEDKIKEPLKHVNEVRKWFKEYFNSIFKIKSDLQFSFFSDSTIIAVPLTDNDKGSTALTGVHSALFAACAVGLFALANKIAIRGGMDIGVAAELKEKEVYGPALERAYHLESRLAEYPRFLVGKELRLYLSIAETKGKKDVKENARKCLNMIAQDTDGRFILDFMGVEVRRIFKCGDDSLYDSAKTAFAEALNFVSSQYNIFKNCGNEKLAARYYRLLNYINSRKDLWGIE